MKRLSGLAVVLVLTLAALLAPARTSSASPCTDICLGELTSCKVDCRFNPYPGCLTFCNTDYQACLNAC